MRYTLAACCASAVRGPAPAASSPRSRANPALRLFIRFPAPRSQRLRRDTGHARTLERAHGVMHVDRVAVAGVAVGEEQQIGARRDRARGGPWFADHRSLLTSRRWRHFSTSRRRALRCESTSIGMIGSSVMTATFPSPPSTFGWTSVFACAKDWLW